MEPIGNALNIDTRTENRECEKHGPYEATLFRMGRRWLGGNCDACAREGQAERERREREERETAHREHLIRRIGIPLRFRDATLASYQPTTERAEKVLTACRRYVETWPERFEKGSSLILSGSVGTGKTHIACAIGKAVAAKYEAHAAYMTVAQAIRRIRATYGQDSRETEQEAFDRLSGVDLLILDEVGIQSGSNHEHATLFEIINRRYESLLPTIVISNLGAKELADAIGDRLVDRLRENGAVLTFAWDSHRGKA